MYANNFCATIDACVLAKAVDQDLILRFRSKELFRVAWSEMILAETVGAVEKILKRKGHKQAGSRAKKVCAAMERAFPDAMYPPSRLGLLSEIPEGVDSKDRHVVATALAAGSEVIVTHNLRDFPQDSLSQIGLQVRTPDIFIADAIELSAPLATEAVHELLRDWNKPRLDPEAFLIMLEANGLVESANLLQHIL